MNIDVFVQARLGSKRLPGKVLLKIGDHPLIWYVLRACRMSPLVREVVALIPENDVELAKVCYGYGVKVVRGPEDDVAHRFMTARNFFQPDAFVRVCADSPLLDWRLLHFGLRSFIAQTPPMLVAGPGYPSGQQFEIVNAEWFHRNSDACDPEHVMPPLYSVAGKELLVLDTEGSGRGDHAKMSVDTEEDFERVKRAFHCMDFEPWHYTWREMDNFMRGD